MKKVHYSDVPSEPVTIEGAEGVTIQWLIGASDGAPNFVMRRFEVAPGGHTPLHEHDWEHEVFILSGSGVVVGAGGEQRFSEGDVIFMPAGERHTFRNDGAQPACFLCLVPLVK